ncbi:MAG: TspO/MBR family protein [Nanoarchaeota archaeon]
MRKKTKENKRYGLLVICLLITYSLGIFGGLFTSSGVQSEWYMKIKPEITPPGWMFGVVWNILFLLMGISLWLVWKSSYGSYKKWIVIVYGINFLTNFLWNVFFFGQNNALLGFVDIIIVGLSVIGMMVVAWRVSRKASWILLPYLIWIIIAGWLNWQSLVNFYALA